MSTSKTVPYSQWPPPALTHAERRRRHWCTCSSCNDGVIQLSPFSSYAMLAMSSSRSVMYVLYTFSCSVLHTLLLTGFKSGEFGGHNIDAEWILAFLFLLAKTAFFNDVTITSSLQCQVLPGLFTIFQSLRKSVWFVPKNYEKLSKSVKIMVKILSVSFYRATRMHSADYAVARCLSVSPSHAGIESKRL